jgi:TRAP-type uncharacterized transport system substrate-binding protein
MRPVLRLAMLVSLAVAIAGFGFAGWYYFTKRIVTLQIAVTSLDSDEARLVAALNRWMAGRNARYRLRPVEVASVKEALEAVARKEIQLAVARADIVWPPTVASAMVLFKDKAVIVSVPRRGVTSLGQLQDKTVGVLGATSPEDPLLAAMMSHGGVTNVRFLPLAAQDLAGAVARNQVQALAHVGPFVGVTLRDTRVARVLASMTGQPSVPGLPDVEAVTAQDRRYEGFDIPAGGIRARPALPEETVSTLAVARHLVIHRNATSFFVARFVAEMLDAKRGVLATNPIAAQMDAPDVEANAAAPVHPAASAYFSDEDTSIGELIAEWGYLALMVAGGLGTAAVWVAHRIWPEAREGMSNLALEFLALRRDAEAKGADAHALRARHEQLMAQLEEQIDADTLSEPDMLALLMTADLADRSLRAARG